MKEIYVLKKDEGQRIDKFLLKYYPLLGKNLLYKALRKKDVKLNGKRAQGSDIIREGDKLSLFISDEKLFRNELESPKKSVRIVIRIFPSAVCGPITSFVPAVIISV